MSEAPWAGSRLTRGQIGPRTIISDPSSASQLPSRSDSATSPPAGTGGSAMR